MAVRASPEEYWRGKMNVQTQEPVKVEQVYTPSSIQLPELNNTALIVLGLVAIVGLLGLFALLGSNNKCRS